MKYCRYCSFCVSGNGYYCSYHKKELSRSQVYKPANCNGFDLSELGCVDTGRKYKPREKKGNLTRQEQIEFHDYEIGGQ